MPRKLKSLFESPRGLQFLLVLRAGVFAILLALAFSGWLWFLLFTLTAFYFYLGESWNIKRFWGSFFILIAVGIFSFYGISGQAAGWPFVLLALFFGLLFFLLLGVKNMVFPNRALPYYFLKNLLFAAVFILFFLSDKSGWFVLRYLLVGSAIFFLFREFLVFNLEESHAAVPSPAVSKKNLIALVLTFLVLQFLWAAALLPLGFLNATSFLLLFILLLDDLLLHNLNGTLTRQIILRDATSFLLIGFVIFVFSRWRP